MVTLLKKQVVGSPPAQAWGAASAFFVFFFTGIFASTWLDVPFVYPPETFPLEVRAKGNAFGTVGWGLGCGTVALLVPVWFACESYSRSAIAYIRLTNRLPAISQYTFLIHGVVNFLTIPVVYYLYPETKKRILEEMGIFSSRLKSPGSGRLRTSLLVSRWSTRTCYIAPPMLSVLTKRGVPDSLRAPSTPRLSMAF